MRALFPFFSLYRHHVGRLILGTILAITGLAMSIGLLSLSGWFLAASALVGSSLIFNFFYPSSGVRGLAIGRTISRYFERLVTHDATFRVLANLRIAVFRKLIPLSPAGLSRYRHSELLNRLVADVDTLDTLYLNLLSPFISAVMVILFMAIGLSFVSVPLTVLICSTLTMLLIILPLLFYHLGKGVGKESVQQRATYRSQFIEWINLNAEFLLFGVQASATEKLQETEKRWQAAQAKESRLGGFSNALLLAINGLLLTVVILLVSNAIHAPAAENPEALIALVTFCTLASVEILAPIGMAFLHLGQLVTAAERLNEITAQTPSVQFSGNAVWQEIQPNQPLVCFEQVDFSYPNQPEQVLKQISLKVHAGQKIAILGKTGSGKSTLFQLLNRHYDPTSGQIILNSCKISEYAEATLRSQLVTLSQRVHIFSSSLRENLQVGRTDVADSECEQVLAQVGLSHLLEHEGLDLWLGDGGRPLSGGELRRLGLARVLLSRASIVLLDEPTEGLDRDTEQHILTLILQHCENRTLLMITHRQQGLNQFDRIYRLDAGKIHEV